MSLDAALRALQTVSLDELDDSAALMTRVDRKYLVPRDLLHQTLVRVRGDGARVLGIDGLRTFRYRTVYFDLPDFALFRQHVQRRRHRYKVRTRTYADSGGCTFEVKSKGYRGCTVKQRISHPPEHPETMGPLAREFAARITGIEAEEWHAVLETRYRRSTLLLRDDDGDQRVTLDRRLAFLGHGRRIEGPSEVLVETKSPRGAGCVDRVLREAGIRPHSVSKYCAAASLLYPDLPGNDWRRLLRQYWPPDATSPAGPSQMPGRSPG